MKAVSIVISLPRPRRRAVELYGRDTPFRPQVVRSKIAYQRNPKHRTQHELV